LMRNVALILISVAICLAAPTDSRSLVVNVDDNIPMDVLFDRYYKTFALQDPSGAYTGSKTILGEEIAATLTFKSATELEFSITGALAVECDNESFTFDSSSGAISLPGADISGDCLHDALSDNSVTLKSVTYDASSDSIAVEVKYSILTITLDLTKSGLVLSKSPDVLPMPVLFDRYYAVFAAQSPNGTYVGSKSALGKSFTATVVFNTTASTFDFSVTGPVSITCNGEAYTYTDGKLNVPGLTADGDCLHDTLAKQHVTLKTFSYDSSANALNVKVGYSIISISLTLKHQA